MLNIAVISGQAGPYNSKKPDGWGKNANTKFKNFNKKIINGENNLKFEIQYSKPKHPIKQCMQSMVKNIENSLSKIGLLHKKSTNPDINYKSLFGYAEEDLKDQKVNIKSNPKLIPADTDNNGKINKAEQAALTLFKDMLDKHTNLNQKQKIKIDADDADGKITHIGHKNSTDLLVGKHQGQTKMILKKIRQKFDLDQKLMRNPDKQ